MKVTEVAKALAKAHGCSAEVHPSSFSSIGEIGKTIGYLRKYIERQGNIVSLITSTRCCCRQLEQEVVEEVAYWNQERRDGKSFELVRTEPCSHPGALS